jgi:hypothetical protein
MTPTYEWSRFAGRTTACRPDRVFAGTAAAPFPSEILDGEFLVEGTVGRYPKPCYEAA